MFANLIVTEEKKDNSFDCTVNKKYYPMKIITHTVNKDVQNIKKTFQTLICNILEPLYWLHVVKEFMSRGLVRRICYIPIVVHLADYLYYCCNTSISYDLSC